MFHDLLALKMQLVHAQQPQMLFHSHFPAADIVPVNAAAETTDQVGSMYYYPSSESQVAWNYGADFGGKTTASWTSGADSLTAANVAQAFADAQANNTAPPSWGKGMFGKYLLADPSYSGANGGFGGNTDYYPLNGDFVIPMCGGKDTSAPCLG